MLRHSKILKRENHNCPQNFVSPAIINMKHRSPEKHFSLAKQRLSLLLQTFCKYLNLNANFQNFEKRSAAIPESFLLRCYKDWTESQGTCLHVGVNVFLWSSLCSGDVKLFNLIVHLRWHHGWRHKPGPRAGLCSRRLIRYQVPVSVWMIK